MWPLVFISWEVMGAKHDKVKKKKCKLWTKEKKLWQYYCTALMTICKCNVKEENPPNYKGSLSMWPIHPLFSEK
jgi:hypothetical protein